MRHISDVVTVRSVFHGIRYVLLDCDGVLWHGDYVLPGISEALIFLRKLGFQIRFISNNATASRAQQLKLKFLDRGIHAELHELYASPWAAAEYLRQVQRRKTDEGSYRGNILVLGNAGLHEEIRQVLAPGFFTYGLELDEPSAMPVYDLKFHRVTEDPLLPPPFHTCSNSHNVKKKVSLIELNISAVVVALDFNASTSKLALATLAMQLPNHPRTRELRGIPSHEKMEPCLFISTNADPSITTGSHKWKLPGAGTLLAALSAATGRAPDMICGKPNTGLFDIMLNAESKNGRSVKPSECLMVGDRLTTDIAFGQSAGARTLFVLSGAEDESHVQTSGITPDYISSSLVETVNLLKSSQSSKL